jgi:dipeptidyl aminopeptidase/acylaminoacyl peptidase
MSRAAAAVDRAATRAAYAGSSRARRRSRAESLGHDQRMEALAAMAQHYAALDHDDYFEPPQALATSSWQRVRHLRDGGEVLDLRWPSRHQPLEPEVATRYQRHVENRSAAARLWLHPEPRPAVVLVHGYLAGQHSVEERAWPLSWFHRIGLDVALFVLPFHGVRAVRGRVGAPPFPNSDPRVTHEGFRQAIGDLRDLVAWLHERGHPQVGAMGMSLGGYTTALAATIEPQLAFAVPIIPLSSIADFARDQGRLSSDRRQEQQQHAALREVYSLISPLQRRSKLAGERVLVVGAEADRITPMHHAESLATQFDAPLVSWHGGHLLQFGRGDGFREVGRLLNRLGIVRR